MRFAVCLLAGLNLAHNWQTTALEGGVKTYNGHPENSEVFMITPLQGKIKTYDESQICVDYKNLDQSLLPLTFEPLPLGTIKPLGWLYRQFRLMANGLPGHIHDFYRIVKNATWGGGDQEYSFLNEAWPYYINGLIPLAYALDDQRLLDAVREQISYVLLKQFPDGWLGPETEIKRRNFWGRYPFFLAAAQYVEAADPFEAADMLRAMHRFVDIMHEMLKRDHQGYVWKEGDNFDEQWGRSRAADMVMALQWLFEHHPENNQDKIHECMFMLYQKAYDWSWWFEEDNFLKHDIESYPSDLIDPLFPFLHVVNVAQGLKSPAVMGRLVHNTSLFDSSRRGVDLVLEYKGTPSGAIYGDERLSGNSPKRGTELCSVVEEMFSLSTLYRILGDASFADRLELVAFNAMPAMITPDWWGHQYVAQTNQPYSYELKDPPFWNVGPWGVTFGLEPNYPCCTVNFPQGYPKLLSNSWVRTPVYKGLAHAVLVPSEVTTILDTILDHGKEAKNNVNVKCFTNYPFTHELTYHIDAEHALNFSFRVPKWVDVNSHNTYIELIQEDTTSPPNQSIQTPLETASSPSHKQNLQPDSHSGLHTLLVPPGKSTYRVAFAAKHLASNQHATAAQPQLQRPVINARPNSAVSLTHGPLLFAHSLPAEYFPRRPSNYLNPDDAPPEANDWTIIPRNDSASNQYQSDSGSYANIPWNIAIDPSTAIVHHDLPTSEHDSTSEPSSPIQNSGFPSTSKPRDSPWTQDDEETPPVSIIVLACEIAWNTSSPIEYEDVQDGNGETRKRAVRGGYPLDPPRPATRDPRTGKLGHRCISRAFMVALKPYSGAKIRIAEFPVVDLSPGSNDLVD